MHVLCLLHMQNVRKQLNAPSWLYLVAVSEDWE